MKFYIVNGSPRKNYNTGQLLDKTVEGIKDTLKSQVPDEEIEIERIDLYSLNYTGCKSCFCDLPSFVNIYLYYYP